MRDITTFQRDEDANAYTPSIRKYRQLDRDISSRIPDSNGSQWHWPVRLRADGDYIDLMTYVVYYPKEPELITGVEWLDNYNIRLPRNPHHNVRIMWVW